MALGRNVYLENTYANLRSQRRGEETRVGVRKHYGAQRGADQPQNGSIDLQHTFSSMITPQDECSKSRRKHEGSNIYSGERS